uniref:Uncharacterized protein n=1 Tax=Glossina pallidipes TaxID=7398 RepID=A0A1B0A0X8_GLOPL
MLSLQFVQPQHILRYLRLNSILFKYLCTHSPYDVNYFLHFNDFDCREKFSLLGIDRVQRPRSHSMALTRVGHNLKIHQSTVSMLCNKPRRLYDITYCIGEVVDNDDDDDDDDGGGGGGGSDALFD